MEIWGLGSIYDDENKTYIDSSTSDKVYKDNNFSVITIKQ